MFSERLRHIFFKEYERWFLWTPVLFGLGIAFYFTLPFEISITVPLTFFFLLLTSLVFAQKFSILYYTFFACFLIVSGFLDIQIQTYLKAKKINFPQNEQTAYIKGRIFLTDFNTNGKPRLWLKNVSDFNGDLKKGIYRITMTNSQKLQIGSCVEMVATFMAPSKALMPNSFEFDRHAFYQGISAVGYSDTPAYETNCLKRESFIQKFETRINLLRNKISEKVQKILPQKEASIASAVLTGNKSLISKSTYKAYQSAGLAHFLAISGLHIGLIAAFAFLFIRFFITLIPRISLKYSSKKIAAVFAIIFSFIYLLISGCSVPAERAFIMTTLVFIGFILDRQTICLRTVSFAALLILIFEPHFLLSASFQLSFAAVTALVSFYEVFQQKNRNRNIIFRPLFYFVGILITTFIASLATLPFALFHFGTLAPYTLLGNLFATPLISFVVMPFIFFALLILPFSSSVLPLKIVGYGLSFINQIAFYISNLPHAFTTISPLPLWSLILITCGGLWLCLWKNKQRFYGIWFILTGIIGFFSAQTPDVLYSADGKTIGLKTPQNELIIFTEKKNNFLNQIWSRGYANTKTFKKRRSIPEINLFCSEEKCIYQNIFEFDSEGKLVFKGEELNPQADFGGAIYFSGNQYKIKTTRENIGHRIWNDKF